MGGGVSGWDVGGEGIIVGASLKETTFCLETEPRSGKRSISTSAAVYVVS